MSDPVFKTCGHPKTPDNIRSNKRCKQCTVETEKAIRRGEPTPAKVRAAWQWSEAIAIIERAATATGSSVEWLLGDCVWAEVSHPRQAAMLAMSRTGLPYTKIGLIMGRDHSTIIAGCKRAAEREAADSAYQAFIAKISA